MTNTLDSLGARAKIMTGIFGTLLSISLNQADLIVSILAGLATFTFMVICIIEHLAKKRDVASAGKGAAVPNAENGAPDPAAPEKARGSKGGVQVWLLLVLAGVVLGLMGAGCSLPWSKSPRQTVTTPGGTQITQTGDAKVPGTVTTTTSAAEIPLPAGTTIRIVTPQSNPTLGGGIAAPQSPAAVAPALEVVIPAATALRASTVTETVKGPEGQAPPTPGEIAKAEGLKWFYIAGLLCVPAAVALFYFRHPLLGGVCALGAVGLPLLGNFLGSEKAVWFGLALAGALVALAVAWFKLRPYHPEYIAEVKAKGEQLLAKAKSLVAAKVPAPTPPTPPPAAT
jgi:hypothetical protein